MTWHNIKFPSIILVPLILCCSCTSEYTTVIRNDSSSDITVEFSGENDNIQSEPAYHILLDSCCKANETAGRLKIRCLIKPGEEKMLGQDVKLFDFMPPFDWGTVIAETAKNKRTVITSWNVVFLTSPENRGSSCGDCGPPRVADVISIK